MNCVTTSLQDRHAGLPSQGELLLLRRALTIAFALVATLVASTGPAAAATAIQPAVQTASTQSDLIALINGYRANNGLQPVSSNGALAGAATWMAGDMAARNYIGHVSSDGRSPTQRMSAFGYPTTSMYTGEDLGAGYGTAGAVFAGWQTSAAHNAVLLNPNYNAIGVGLVYNASSTYKWFWAADFGGPGGTVKAVVPPAPPAPPPVAVAQPKAPAVQAAQPALERPAAAPRGAAAQPAADAVDPAARARAAETHFIEATARRITTLYAALHRMGAI
jgi:uncharacterized protein YkwD